MASGKRHNICILGSEAAGKTCFIAALAYLGKVRGSKDFVISAPDDTRTQSWLNDLSRSLTGGHWPPSTTATATYDFMLEYTSASFHMTVMDYSGEAFRNGLDKLDPESLNDLQRHLFAADTILLLLDPVSDLDVRGTDSADMEQREQRLSALFNAVLKCIHLEDSGNTDKKLKKNIALLVTKADSIPPEYRKISAASLIEKAAPKFYSTIRNHSRGLRCFYISAVGGDNSGLSVMPEPPEAIKPEGYDDLFKWLCRCEINAAWRRIRRRVVMSAAALTVVLLGLFAYEGREISVLQSPSASEDRKISISKRLFIFLGDEARKQIDAILKTRLQKFRDDLEQIAALDELGRLRSELEKVSQYENHTYSNEISILRGAIDDKGEDLYYHRIISATNPDEQIRAIEEYRTAYPSGKYIAEVAELGKSTYDKRKESERQTINAIQPLQAKASFPSFLQNKASAVDGYRKAHVSDPSEQERMESASRTASILATQTSYDITVDRAEMLNDARPSIVIIKIDGKKFLQTEEQENARPNWDQTGKVDWTPGDKVKIEWKYVGWWMDGPIAVLESDALDSLKILSGQVELQPSEMEEYLSPGGKPHVSLSIQGIPEEAWVDFHEFIYPGGYWRK